MEANNMTFEQSYKFLTEMALATFPLVFKSLQESPNPSRTVELWARALAGRISMAEGAQVLDGWITGEIEMYSYADQYQWATAIIREVKRMRGKRYAEQLQAETYAELSDRQAFAKLNYNRAGQADCNNEDQVLANLEYTARMATGPRVEFSPHIAELLGRS